MSVLLRIVNFCSNIICIIINQILGIIHGKGKIVSPVKNPLLLKSATQLAKEIREGKLKSEDVVQAYIERIVEVEPLINATIDCCFQDALGKAREVDLLIDSGEYSKEQLANLKPLLGVPITIKNLLKAKGLRSTVGCKFYENVIATEDAVSVSLMKNAGAIVIATTNVPELGLGFESRNKLHGVTCNPFDTSKTSGGSSGGESALIGAGGSVLGLGNDLLGSLRVPCHFTGTFSHKPSRGLVSNEGAVPFQFPPDYDANKFASTGPMCRYAEDLVIGMKVILPQNSAQLKLGEQVNFKKLKILYLTEIETPLAVPVEKEILVALKKAVSHFKMNYDITPKEVKMPWLFDANRCVQNVIFKGLGNLKAIVLGENAKFYNETSDLLKTFIGKSTLSVMPIINLNLSKLFSRKSKALYYKKMREKWINEFENLLEENTVLLMPTLPVTAPYHHGMFPLFPSTIYTSIINVVGLPSTQCPLGYNQRGLPYGIQIIAGRNNDALTIACAIELEKAFGGWKSPGSL